MKELFIDIERACLELGTAPLLITGLLATGIGLFLWLGGARYVWFVVGLLGASIGAALGCLVSGWFNVDMIISISAGSIICSMVSIFMQNIIIILIAIVIFSMVFGSGYLGYSVNNQSLGERIDQRITLDKLKNTTEKIDKIASDNDNRIEKITESIKINETNEGKLGRFIEKIKKTFNDFIPEITPRRGKLAIICIAGAIAGLILAQLLKIIIMALCCSIVGTTTVIGGVLLLVMAEGTEAISVISNRPKFFPSLFIIMTIFGWLVQIIITRPQTKKSNSDDED